MPPLFRVASLSRQTPLFIRGGTLERFFPVTNFERLRLELGGITQGRGIRFGAVRLGGRHSLPRRHYLFLVYAPSPAQLRAYPCDGCPTRHRPTNLGCSRTLGKLSRFTRSTMLYSFADRDKPGMPFSSVATYRPPGAHVSVVLVKADLVAGAGKKNPSGARAPF